MCSLRLSTPRRHASSSPDVAAATGGVAAAAALLLLLPLLPLAAGVCVRAPLPVPALRRCWRSLRARVAALGMALAARRRAAQV